MRFTAADLRESKGSTLKLSGSRSCVVLAVMRIIPHGDS